MTFYYTKMSFLFADRKKQIAVVNKPTDSNTSGLFITGSLDLLNQNSVAGLANATLVGNLTEAANLIYPNSRGSLTYHDALVIEGLPHIALSPSVGSVVSSSRINGIGVGLGFSVNSVGTRIYNKPAAVLDIMAANADVRITGGQLSAAGTSSLIMVGSKASVGAISGFKFDVIRSNTDPTIDEARMFLRPYNVNTNLSALVSVNYDGNVGIGTSMANSALHVISNLPSVSAVNIETEIPSASGLAVRTKDGAPLRIITGYPDTEELSLLINGVGQVGVKVDPTGVTSDPDNNLALAVNGSIRATNSIYAFGTFSYAAGVFAKKDTFNVSTLTATIDPAVLTVQFFDTIPNYNTENGMTIVVSETSGNTVIPYITSKSNIGFTVRFIDSKTGSATSFTEFSFIAIVNTDSLYQTASIVQAVF